MASQVATNDASTHPDIEWRRESGQVPYREALAEMEARNRAIHEGTASELIWLLEHPALYTKGSSGAAGDLLVPTRFPVFETGRGGAFTYHGPGQLVLYPILDLRGYRQDVHWYMRALE